MPSSFTTNKGLEKPANGEYVDTWNVPVNSDMDVIDQALGGITSLNATGGSAILTDTQYRSLILAVSGAMSASVIYTIPSGIGGQWIIRNTTTDASGGPWTVTIASGGGGTSVVAPRGYVILVYSNGTDIRQISGSIIPNSVNTSDIVDGAVTFGKIDSAAIATSSQYRSNTADKILDTDAVWASAALVGLVDGTNIAVDMSAGYNFSVTLAGNRTLSNPTNPKIGQSGIFVVTQDAVGGRTLAFGGNYKFANGVVPPPDTTANRVNIYSYIVVSATFILMSMQKGVR